MLVFAALLLVLIGIVHSFLGEKYILIRLFKRELPPLFGNDTFTKQVLRFAWHLTTVAWFGFAAILCSLAPSTSVKPDTLLYIISGVFLVSGVLSFTYSKGKHYSYLVFWAVAVICAYAAYIN